MRRAIALPIYAALVGVVLPFASRAIAEVTETAPAASGSASTSTSPSTSASPVSSVDSASSTSASSSASGGPTTPPRDDPGDLPPRKKRPAEKVDDPLAIPEGVKSQIGATEVVTEPATGVLDPKGLFPLAYEQRLGRQLTISAWPFYYYRKQENAAGRNIDNERFATFYYGRRSLKHDVDAVFPVYFHWRDEDTHTTVIPPVLWRDGPSEWHRWIAPLFFWGGGTDSGYFHSPILLTTSTHSKKRAFSLIGGIGYYDRKERDVDWGIVPFVFGGNNADKLTNYLVIPPLLTYHREDNDAGKKTTLVGPVFYQTTPTSSIIDVLPLFFHNEGTENGASYSTTGILPLFWWSRSPKSEVLITLLGGRAKDADGETIITPVYSRYRGRTSLDLFGPIVPLFGRWSDPDLFKESWFVGPVYWSNSPSGSALLTPLFGHWRESGVSRTTWVFPTFVHSEDATSWSTNLHPLVYLGGDADSSHTVIAPFYWDFQGPHYRTTVGFPLFWRLADDDGVTQVAVNTLWIERKVGKGLKSKDFYFLPLLHIGDQPDGDSWDILFGFLGYRREGSYKQLKLLWATIDLTANPAATLKSTKKE